MAEIKSIQPDNDIFCSMYRKDYIFWKEYDHRTKATHDDHYRLTPEGAEKFSQGETKLDFSQMEQYLEDMKELNKLRLRTIYRLEYVPKSSYRILKNVDKEKFSPKNDDFLIDGAIRFGVPQGKVMAPLPTARRTMGYSAYDDYRTPLSTYQDIHGRVGYDRVRQAADGGYWRMGPRYDHEKEMADIKNVLKRESDITEREKEEKLLEEELLKKQLEHEREELIRKSLEKRNSRKRGTVLSSRYLPDPRGKSSANESKESSVPEYITPPAPVDSPALACNHTKEEHEDCLRRKRTMAGKPCHCKHDEEEHEKCNLAKEANEGNL